jgi:superfamily II DNA or RNA helicase
MSEISKQVADRLQTGPWQAFERDVARLMIHSNFQDVKVVGGSGDKGADILAMKNGELWIVQCKFSSTGNTSPKAIQEVINAGTFYRANRLAVAFSCPVSKSVTDEIKSWANRGLDIGLLDPKAILSFAEQANEYSLEWKRPRDYQKEAVELASESLRTSGRGLIVLATGLGKSLVMAELVADLLRVGALPNKRILVLAHTRAITKQLIVSFWSQLPYGIQTNYLDGNERPSSWEGITFSTYQSYRNLANEVPTPDLVMVDEAHSSGAENYKRLLSNLSGSMIFGVTATPWRGDKFQIEEIFGPSLLNMGISEGMKRGFLSEVDYRLLADNLDWESIEKLSKENYTVKQLNKKLLIPTRDTEAIKMILSIFNAENRKSGLVFSPSIEHAEYFAGMLRSYNLPAETIHSQLDEKEQTKLLTRFRKGEFKFMTSVDMFNEGVDVPDVDIIVFMRVTHSRRIFVQQLGRGLRIKKGKDKVVVLDFVSDLSRIAEIISMRESLKGSRLEKLELGGELVNFVNLSKGSFAKEWLLDQAKLDEPDPKLTHLDPTIFDYPD